MASDDLVAKARKLLEAHAYAEARGPSATWYEDALTRSGYLLDDLADALEAASKYIEARESEEPACTGPHDSQGCYECHLRSESLKYIRETGDAYHGQ